MNDQFFMREALKLAKKGLSWTNPHPMVGAVIVKNGQIIAKGYHKRFGLDHAEMEALKNAKEDVKGASLYVTMEPCQLPYDLYGPRVPCTEITRNAGISTVHIASLDSNPEVAGLGSHELEKMGIKTTLGTLAMEELELNESYHHFMTKGRPFIVSTFSVSLDGKIATFTGDSQWITNEKTRNYNRILRANYQAILVGIQTVLKDDPHLGARIKGKKDPIRIILDSTLKIPLKAQVLRDQHIIIATTQKADKKKLEALQKSGIRILQFESDKIPLKLLLDELKKQKIISVFIEGGGRIHGSFFDLKLVDKVYAFYAPIILGGEKAISAIGGKGAKTINEAIVLKNIQIKHFRDNFLVIGYP